MITNMYRDIYRFIRNDTKNVTGADAMAKYIREINALNNVAIDHIDKRNIVVETLGNMLQIANSWTSKQLKKQISKIQAVVGTKEGVKFEEEFDNFINYCNTNNIKYVLEDIRAELVNQ